MSKIFCWRDWSKFNSLQHVGKKLVILKRYNEIAMECRSLAEELDTKDFRSVIDRVNEGVRITARAWSRSWLGYQAHVYYRGLQTPPPGDHFSSEWGFERAFSNSNSDNWVEMSIEDVEGAIYNIAGSPNLSDLKVRSSEITKLFRKFQSELVGLLTVDLERTRSEALE